MSFQPGVKSRRQNQEKQKGTGNEHSCSPNQNPQIETPPRVLHDNLNDVLISELIRKRASSSSPSNFVFYHLGRNDGSSIAINMGEKTEADLVGSLPSCSQRT